MKHRLFAPAIRLLGGLLQKIDLKGWAPPKSRALGGAEVNSAKLKFIPASTIDETPTLLFQVVTAGGGTACAASVGVMLIAPTPTAKLKANNAELAGPALFLWRQGYLLIGSPGDLSTRTIARCEQY